MSRAKAAEEIVAQLGKAARDATLGVYLECNPDHRQPWPAELRDFSLQTWVAVAAALIRAGWRPPGEG